MKQFIFFMLLILGMTFSGIAGDGNDGDVKKSASAKVTLSGCVEDMLNSEKLVCAKIEIEELNKTIFTDILGNYEISDVKPGIYTLKVSYISYEEKEICRLNVDNSKELNIQLKPL